jgi:hypothetical protein
VTGTLLPLRQLDNGSCGYTFENNPHHYLPDVVGTLADGTPFIAEAGMEDDKRGDRIIVQIPPCLKFVFTGKP